MMSGINSPNCNYGQSMSISEENSAVNSEIELNQSNNWHREIGNVKMSFPKVEHFLTAVVNTSYTYIRSLGFIYANYAIKVVRLIRGLEFFRLNKIRQT